MLVRRVLILMFAAFLVGCSATAFRVGSDFDVKIFTGKVARGVTTKSQVSAWLGSPSGTGGVVEVDGTRFDEWTYYFAAGNMSNLSGTEVKTLQIKFDSDGVVQGYHWTTPSR
ncbi:MAG: outer membrane protein assembly factor BamE [Gallionella sp.]|nr:outer membrane protein assembly factor BamE [Gallionella sp.]